MTQPRPLEQLNPMPAEPGKWVYGKSLAPMLDGRLPVAAPGGLATIGPDGKLQATQRGNRTVHEAAGGWEITAREKARPP